MTAITFPRPPRPRVSVLMVTYGGWRWVERALRALAEGTDPVYELVIVDNASPDGLARTLADDVAGATLVLNDENLGFGAASNQAADRARGEALVFLNSDAYVRPGWLPPLLEAAGRPGVAAVAPRILNDDETLQEAGCLLYDRAETEFYGYRDDPSLPPYAYPRDVDYASAACLLVRRSAFTASGGFDPLFAPAYYEDVDLCLRLRASGLRCVYEPRSTVVHSRGLSTGGGVSFASAERNGGLFRTRWRELLTSRPSFFASGARGSDRSRIAARDALADSRVLVVTDALPETPTRSPLEGLLAALASRRPSCVTTLLTLSDRRPDDEAVSSLAGAGIELVAAPEDVAEWLERRRFHYDVVLAAALPNDVERALAHAQPQAERVRPPDQEPLDELLTRLGIAPATARA